MQQILFTENNDGRTAKLNSAAHSLEIFGGGRHGFGTGKARKKIFDDAGAVKKPFGAPPENSHTRTTATRLFPCNRIDKDKPKQLFAILLGYLDQIVYLDELSENLEQLDFAIAAKNTGEMKRIALECAAASRCCGLFAAIKAQLSELERVEHEYQLADAADLSRQIVEASEQFRFILKENMQQMAIAR